MESRTTCHLSIEPPSDVIEVKSEIQKTAEENEDDEDMSKKVEYHVLKATAITRKNMWFSLRTLKFVFQIEYPIQLIYFNKHSENTTQIKKT